MRSPGASPPSVVVQASGAFAAVDFRELWAYRELLYFLIWRDVKVRYKQTALGAAWAVLQPLLLMLVFSLFFGRLAGISSGDVPYPVFAFAALVPWTFYATALSQASNSLVEQERVISKVYFPRLLVPTAAVAAGLPDVAISLVVLIGLMLVYGIAPTTAVWCLPLLIAFAALTALAVGIWLSALNVKYRDVRYTLTFLVQLWLFASPVVYPSTLVPEAWRPLYAVNPMVGVIDGFRWALLGSDGISGVSLAVSVGVVILTLVGGVFYFRSMERTFADVV
jgi:lipopolysaccharide transport system permease protein